jgi:hypothetical protein
MQVLQERMQNYILIFTVFVVVFQFLLFLKSIDWLLMGQSRCTSIQSPGFNWLASWRQLVHLIRLHNRLFLLPLTFCIVHSFIWIKGWKHSYIPCVTQLHGCKALLVTDCTSPHTSFSDSWHTLSVSMYCTPQELFFSLWRSRHKRTAIRVLAGIRLETLKCT